MMIEVRNNATGQKHYDSINGQFQIDQGPHFGRPVFSAYPTSKYTVVLLDSIQVLADMGKATKLEG